MTRARRRPVQPLAPPPPQGTTVPRGLILVAWGSLAAALVALIVPYFVLPGDMLIQMQLGAYVLTHGWPATTEQFSFVANGRPFLDPAWGSEVLWYLIYTALGVPGLIVLKLTFTGAAYGFAFQTARLLKARLSVLVLTAPVVLFIVCARVVERPALTSTLLIAVYLWLYVRYRTGHLHGQWLWVLPPLQMLWTNAHGGHPQGLAMVAIVALGEAAMWARARYGGFGVAQALPRREVLRLAALVPACLAAACITPYGPRLLIFPFQLTSVPYFMQVGEEWNPLPAHGIYYGPWFLAYVGLLLGLWAAWMGVCRDRAPFLTRTRAAVHRGLLAGVWLSVGAIMVCALHAPVGLVDAGGWVSPTLTVLLYGLLGLWLLCALVNWRTVEVSQALLVALFYFESLRHMRVVADAALVMYPLMTAAVSTRLDRWERVPAGSADRARPAAILLGCGLLLGLSAFVAAVGYYPRWDMPGFARGYGMLADCAVDFLARQHIRGHALNSMPRAGLLIARLHPDVRVSGYDFDFAFGETLYREVIEVNDSTEALDAFLATYRVDVIVQELRHYRLAEYLLPSAWVPVYLDDKVFVLVQRTPAMAEVIARFGYRHIKPWSNEPVTVGNAGEVLREADQALAACPHGATFAWAYKAEALRILGRNRESFEARRKIPEQLVIK